MPKHEDVRDDHRPEEGRALNTQEHALRAIATARSCLSKLSAGEIWVGRAPRGEVEIKGALLLDGVAVVALRFNPNDGSILPKGLHAMGAASEDIVNGTQAQEELKGVVGSLTVLEGAEYREPESCWAIPLASKGRIVADLKVAGDGTRVVPDRKLQEDSRRRSPL
jgi:hypothetical protein